MKRIIELFICALLVQLAPCNLSGQDSVRDVISWLTDHSAKINSLEDENNFEDLVSFKKAIGNAQLVGLGEGTHGTFEFVKMRKRLIQFLVTQMHFTALVLESSYASCEPINDYLLFGKGDRASVLTSQGYTPWDNEEFSSILDWLREYNQKVPAPQKVRFYGMDLCYNEGGRRYILSYLKKYAMDKNGSADSVFQTLASEESNWPTRLDQNKLQQSYIPLHNLVSYFDNDEKKLTARSGWQKWDSARHYLMVMEYWVLANLTDTPKSLVGKKMDRDVYMGQNLSYIIDREQPATKFIIWAHNGHISCDKDTADPCMGNQLRKRYGSMYYALGLYCYEGTFQTRELLQNGFWGSLKTDTIPPVENSISGYLNRTGKEKFYIDFRGTSADPFMAKWMNSSHTYAFGTWKFRGASKNLDEETLQDEYDGILFIRQSSPTHPTKNALERCEKNIGF
ncbi:MAG TPA: erythromycin esterase family protein [Puia sp.]|nr:erythromycin esterase family protein [Puia sp.]